MTAHSHVAVLMGGCSAEREISLITGRGCTEALREHGYQVTEIDVDFTITETLMETKPDVVFNALHGPGGEDGCIQGLLEILKIPYTHSGVSASALAMNKHYAKAIFRDAGLPVADSITSTWQEVLSVPPMKPPYVIKPINQGSSVGVYIIHVGDNSLPDALGLKLGGEAVMVERYVPGRELTCAVMENRALEVIEITPSESFYNYEAKYEVGKSEHVLPADLPVDIYQSVQNITLEAHNLLGCQGVTRADFRFDESRSGIGLVLLEINTQPGMTPVSLVPKLAAYEGISYSDLVCRMVEDASCSR
ncbi:MAG: D-alanine--D-alanine ligase [Parvularculales bacterium]